MWTNIILYIVGVVTAIGMAAILVIALIDIGRVCRREYRRLR